MRCKGTTRKGNRCSFKPKKNQMGRCDFHYKEFLKREASMEDRIEPTTRVRGASQILNKTILDLISTGSVRDRSRAVLILGYIDED